MKKGPIAKNWPKVQALWELIKDPKAAWSQKAIAIGALVYLISPIDAVPDPIPGLGLSDDVAVLLAAIAALGVALQKYNRDRQRSYSSEGPS
ncbi:MAG: YkvA family protein [Candidatus Binatia bacterium]